VQHSWAGAGEPGWLVSSRLCSWRDKGYPGHHQVRAGTQGRRQGHVELVVQDAVSQPAGHHDRDQDHDLTIGPLCSHLVHEVDDRSDDRRIFGVQHPEGDPDVPLLPLGLAGADGARTPGRSRCSTRCPRAGRQPASRGSESSNTTVTATTSSPMDSASDIAWAVSFDTLTTGTITRTGFGRGRSGICPRPSSWAVRR
jgi:hypothetical protein